MIIRSLIPNIAITLGDPPHPQVRTYRIYQQGNSILLPDDEVELFRFRVDGAVNAGLIEIVQDTAQARLNSGSATTMQAFCSAVEQVGNLVYVSAANTVAQADASDPSKIQVVGYIVSKPATNVCRVSADPGPVAGSGLTVSSSVYLSATTPGGVTTTAPSLPNALVEVGVAMSSTTFFFTGAKVIV